MKSGYITNYGLSYNSPAIPNLSSFTRPNDTTAYAANDVISGSTSPSNAPNAFDGIYSTGMQTFGYITGAKLTSTNSAIIARMRAHLCIDPGLLSNQDNAAFSGTLADVNYLGYIDFGAMSPNASYAYAQSTTIRMFLRDIPNGLDLYWTLQTLDAYTPVANSVFTLGIYVDTIRFGA